MKFECELQSCSDWSSSRTVPDLSAVEKHGHHFWSTTVQLMSLLDEEHNIVPFGVHATPAHAEAKE